jgi:hypothetical protein
MIPSHIKTPGTIGAINEELNQLHAPVFPEALHAREDTPTRYTDDHAKLACNVLQEGSGQKRGLKRRAHPS